MGSLDSGRVLPRATATAASGFSAQAVVSALLDGEAKLRALLNPVQVEELGALEKESDPAMFWQDLVNFAGKLERSGRSEIAAQLYATIVESARASVGNSAEGSLLKAQARMDAIQGRGAFGGRAEFLLDRFAHDAADPRVILPMLAGTLVYNATRAAALSRLAGPAQGAWYRHGFAARLTAATAGFAAEVPTFALGSRALRSIGAGDSDRIQPSIGHELASAAITLGCLKSFSFLGNQAFQKFHGIGEFGAATRLQSLSKSSQFVFSQSSMFTGLLTAHRLEAGLGLRPQVDGATTLTDTLASMLSLSIGAHLGHRFLGPGFGALQRELSARSELLAKSVDFAPRLRPLFASADPASNGMLVSLTTGSGRSGEPSTGDPSRVIRELQIDLTANPNKPKARRKALEDLKNHLMAQLHGDPCIPEGARAIRELFEDPDEAVATAAMEHYGTLFLVGYEFGTSESRQGQRTLERLRDDGNLSAARRKKADLALTYIEGGKELNDTANFRHLEEESTQPFPEPRPPRAPNLERLFLLVFPLQLRKLFLDPNTTEANAELTRQRYIAVMHTRPVDLPFEAEMLELRKRFGGWNSHPLNLETPEAQRAALTFVELALRYSPEDLGGYEAISMLRKIFSYDGHSQPAEILHQAFANYFKLLYLDYYQKNLQWWHGELNAVHEKVKSIHLLTVQPPSPWVQKGGLAAELGPELNLDYQTDIQIIRAYAALLRPLLTTDPTLSAGMHMLERLSRRRAGVDPIKSNYVRQLLELLRAEKLRTIPEIFTAKGWGVDPHTGKPVYIDRQLDPRVYRITDLQMPEGPYVLIEGPDLVLRLPGTRSGGGLGGAGP